MHTNLFFLFKTAFYSSTLVITIFKSNFELKFLLQHYKPVFFNKLRNPHGTPTFKTKALCLVSNVQLDMGADTHTHIPTSRTKAILRSQMCASAGMRLV